MEQLGIERSRAAATAAGLILAVFDGSEPLTDEDREVLQMMEQAEVPVIALINKSDLPQRLHPTDSPLLANAISISAASGLGLDALRDVIQAQYHAGALRPDGGMITNRRQADALRRAAESAAHAAEALHAGFTPDIAWVDAEAALTAIGEVTGKTVSDEILSRVFERFCVGK